MKFEVSCFIEDGMLILKLNNETIIQGSGRFDMTIEKGMTHTLKWEVNGKKGTTFSISVSSPQLAEFHMSKVIGLKEKDLGKHVFEI